MITWSNLTSGAKALLVTAVSAASVMQIDAVKNKVTPYVALHPKLASTAAAFFFIVALLHNPLVLSAVNEAFGIKKTVVQEEIIPLAMVPPVVKP